jgi:hypothetical protein
VEKQPSFPDAVAYRLIDDGFDPLLEWLDAHPDRDVTEFVGWHPLVDSSPPLSRAATTI